MEKTKLDIISDKELETYLVKKAYKFTDEEISSGQFIFWLVYYMEKRLTGMLKNTLKVFVQCSDDSVKKIIDIVFEESYLSAKITVLEKSLSDPLKMESPETKGLCGYYREINNIRNSLFHNKEIKDIKYKGKSILDRKTKELMIRDLFAKLIAFHKVVKEANKD